MKKLYLVTTLLISYLIIGSQLILYVSAQGKKESILIKLRSTSWEERYDGLKELGEFPDLLKDEQVRDLLKNEEVRRELINLLEKENPTANMPLEKIFGAEWHKYHLYYRRLVDIVVLLHDPNSIHALISTPLSGGYIEPGAIIMLLTTIDPVVEVLTKGNPIQKQGAARVISDLLSMGSEKIKVSEENKNKIKEILLSLLENKAENPDVRLMSIYSLRYFPDDDVILAVERARNDPYYYISYTGEKRFPLREAAEEVIQELKDKMQQRKRER